MTGAPPVGGAPPVAAATPPVSPTIPPAPGRAPPFAVTNPPLLGAPPAFGANPSPPVLGLKATRPPASGPGAGSAVELEHPTIATKSQYFIKTLVYLPVRKS